MKVFNLTDVTTNTLKQYGMDNHTLVVDHRSVAPGASIDVPEDKAAEVKVHLEHLLLIGAVAIDNPPEDYAGSKKKPPASRFDRDRVPRTKE